LWSETTGPIRGRTLDACQLPRKGKRCAILAHLTQLSPSVPSRPARPVEVLAAIHDAVRPDGLLVIMDEAVADEFVAPGDPVEQVMYGYSTLICLPDGLSTTPSEGTGTVMRRSVLTDYATRAGFTSVEVLPIEDFAFLRFYRLPH
jgi:hypothetical protein